MGWFRCSKRKKIYGNTGEKVLGKIYSKNEFVVIIDDLYISFNNYNKPVSYA